jgi:hypothetical protein
MVTTFLLKNTVIRHVIPCLCKQHNSQTFCETFLTALKYEPESNLYYGCITYQSTPFIVKISVQQWILYKINDCVRLLKIFSFSVSSIGTIYLSMALQSFLLDVGRFFSFFILYTVGRTPWTGDQSSQSRYLHTEQHKQNKRTQTSMPWMGFEPTIPAFERAKTVHSLNRDHCDRPL